MNEAPVTVVKILPTKVWGEYDFLGDLHVMLQYEGMTPFVYATFFYNYAYTDNATIRAQAEELAVALGAEKPIEFRIRPIDPNPSVVTAMDDLRADAERYRWLRVQPNNTDTPRIDVVRWTREDDSANCGEGLRMEALDAAIDAARKEGSAS